jgi:hypothetical protein
MDCPCNATELRMFIGCVNYCDMWPSCAHILKPFTNQSGLKKRAPIKWTDDMQQAFDKMRLLMAADALAPYPNHNKRFGVYTDASGFQLGTCIIQEGRPVAYFLQKADKISAKLYNNGKGNAFHRLNSQRILKYAPWCEHSCFYGP